MARFRPALRSALLVLCALLLPVSLLAGWANATIYDSTTFSERSVDLLNSPAVRRELASRITEQLARDGNQQAVNFRPAYQLAIEAVIDTDTFRSIFRTAVKRTHQALLVNTGDGTAAGLDLSDSVAIISSTLQLPQDAKPSEQSSASLGSSLTDVTQRIGSLGLWKLDDLSAALFVAALAGALACAAGSIALADDRRRAVRRLGMVVVGDGVVILGLVALAGVIAGSRVGDAQLAAAVEGAIARATADLSSIALWVVGYGLVLTAAAGAMAAEAKRVTPASTIRWVSAWVEHRRASTRGTVALGSLTIVGGLALVSAPAFWLRAAVLGAGMWLVYFGITELLRLVRSSTASTLATSGPARRRRYLVIGGLAAVLAVVVTVGGVLATQRAATRSAEAGEQRCNGDASLCDLPLNAAVFPASHNSMSSALYPGWLFAEQIDTIGGQLSAGVRALLIDTHYGVPSSSRLPGSETPIVLTDRAAELEQPPGEDIDPVIAERAAQLAARAPASATASRDLYLCHNFCELGAIPFSRALGEVTSFVDTHPDDVVMLIIQDATTPEDTAAAIEAAGLGDKVWTLDPTAPLPTLGEMIEAGRTVLVFAEEGGPGGPDWYHPAYEWFQETRYKWSSTEDMTCEPNRGPADAPLFLVNHWVGKSPPDPSSASRANSDAVLRERLERCADERGLVPNVVATDFAERGDLVRVVREINESLRESIRQLTKQARASVTGERGRDHDATVAGPSSVETSALPVFGDVTRYTVLTGGVPERFCASVSALQTAGAAWALASYVASAADLGLADLAYAPLSARALDATVEAAPVEVVERLALATARSHAAIEALRAAGLDQVGIDELADLATEALADPARQDPVALQQELLDHLEARLGAGAVRPLAASFAAANPQPVGLFDFGDASDEVARSSGYGCLVQ